MRTWMTRTVAIAVMDGDTALVGTATYENARPLDRIA
jgi:hypothetical protein